MTTMARKREAARKAESAKRMKSVSEMSDAELCERANEERASGVVKYGMTSAMIELDRRMKGVDSNGFPVNGIWDE